MFKKIQRIHMVGIGGSGMSGIAEVLLNRGYLITGSDLKLSPITARLVSLGARINEGHSRDQLDNADLVVFSSAVKRNNPEVSEAQRRKIPTIPRAEMLAELMRMKYGITIAGTHGKTTTTSMVATVLGNGGLDPTVVLGGRLDTYGSNAKLGTGEFMIVEADESDRSFLLLSPTVAIVTNIDEDHMESYSSVEDLKNTFLQFVNKVPFYGVVVLCLDDSVTKSIVPKIKRRIITYGFCKEADLHISNTTFQGSKSQFSLHDRGNLVGKFELKIPGRHNILNAVAAIAVGLDLGISVKSLCSSLTSFSGVDRRFQLKGAVNGITLIDDYAHHPTEIAVTLEAAKHLKYNRLVVIFQPHRYTRTQYCFGEFIKVLQAADIIFLTDIYAAGEEPIKGVTSNKLISAIQQDGHQHTHYLNNFNQVSQLVSYLRDGDLVITMGAGNIWIVANSILEELNREEVNRN